MIALLWKDVRVNRLILILGAVLLVGPIAAWAFVNVYGHWRYDAFMKPWPELLIHGGLISLSLSLLTVTLLAGNAVAGERADRSAEFLAYLPPTRAAVITSKIMLALGTSLILCLASLAALYIIAPALGEVPPDALLARADAAVSLSAAAVALFGGAWLASCCLSSPTIATGLGVGLVCYVFVMLAIVKEGLGYKDLDFE